MVCLLYSGKSIADESESAGFLLKNIYIHGSFNRSLGKVIDGIFRHEFEYVINVLVTYHTHDYTYGVIFRGIDGFFKLLCNVFDSMTVVPGIANDCR